MSTWSLVICVCTPEKTLPIKLTTMTNSAEGFAQLCEKLQPLGLTSAGIVNLLAHCVMKILSTSKILAFFPSPCLDLPRDLRSLQSDGGNDQPICSCCIFG